MRVGPRRRPAPRSRVFRRRTPQAIATLIAAAAATSSTVAPRERSHTGRAKPCRKGADRARAAEVLAQLVADVARVEVREHEDVGAPRDFARTPELRLRDPWHERGIGLELAVDRELRGPGADDLHCPADLVHPFVLRAAVGRERQHRDPWRDAEETLGALRRGDCDVREGARIGVDVDRAVREHERVVAIRGDDEEEARGSGDAFRESHRHEPGLDHPGRGLTGSRDERIRVPGPDGHRRVEERPREQPSRHPIARPRPALDVERCVPVEPPARHGRHALDPVERDPRPGRGRFELRTLPDQHGASDAFVVEASRGANDPRVAALGQGNGPGVRPRALDESFDDVHGRLHPRRVDRDRRSPEACVAPAGPGRRRAAYA